MASIIYDAEKYVVADPLSNLGWAGSSVYSVQDVAATGRKCWRSFNAINSFTLTAYTTDAQPIPLNSEILLVSNFTCTELGDANMALSGSAKHNTSGSMPFANFQVNVTSAGVVTVTLPTSGDLTYTRSVAPTSITQNTAMAMRLRIDTNGSKYYAKMWGAAVDGLEAAEPVDWNYEIDFAGDVNGGFDRFSVTDATHAHQNRVSMISLGTSGDTALFTLPEQTVAVPTGLSATPTDTTASLVWT